VLDEVETLQRVRSDVRDRGLNALRQLIDEVDSRRYPGLYLVITGTQAFYDGPQGVQRLAPLAARLATDFTTNARFDNPRAVQLRLPGFGFEALCEVGYRVRDLYAAGASAVARIRQHVDDDYVQLLARSVAGELGQQVGIAPRVFLKKLVGDVLDRVDQFDDFDPRRDYALTVAEGDLTELERNARAANDVDDIDLEVLFLASPIATHHDFKSGLSVAVRYSDRVWGCASVIGALPTRSAASILSSSPRPSFC
jgi:GAF domain-containing protein